MKKSICFILQLIAINLFVVIDAQASNVIFKATLKTTENEAIPNVYVKIYIPGESQAIDSLFSSTIGIIEHELPFTYQSGSSFIDFTKETPIIVKKMSPNIISQGQVNYIVEYNYPCKPELYFVDIQGRTYHNNTELSAGMYYYYLRFDDGRRSELSRIVVVEKSIVNAKLVANIQPKKTITILRSYNGILDDVDVFYPVFIKDGYVTKRDTVMVDSVVIEKDYNLTTADLPTASFTYSGNMKTGDMVLFDASASIGPHGESLVYSWDFGNGKKGQSVAIPHLYNVSGEYDVTLTVTGNYGAKHSVKHSITILPDTFVSEYTGVVNGYITNADHSPIEYATVSLDEGDNEATTDIIGMVTMTELPVGAPIHLKITKEGYVNQVVELTVPDDATEAHFFTTLKKRNTSITLSDAEFGGMVDGEDGAKVMLPVEGLIKLDGTVAKGDINVSITPVNVASEAQSFPGVFRGINSSGTDGVLLSYGVSEFHFEQDNERLQMALGKTASILIPIYTSGAGIGDEIPLWSVNEDNGTWVQEGIGTVVESEESPSGLALDAIVGHFSWWNCDTWDSISPKDGLCYILDCTSAICVRRPVGCWINGARRDRSMGGGSIVLKKASNIALDEEEELPPPVFEVREYLPSIGKELRFPGRMDVYLEARGFGAYGEKLVGTYLVRPDVDKDSVKIQLFPYEEDDKEYIDLEIDSAYAYYLEKDSIMNFRFSLPAENIYRVDVKTGDYPKLKGIYIIRDDGGLLHGDDITKNPRYIYSDTCKVYIQIMGNNINEEGNFIVGIFSEEPELLNIYDSITVSLPVDTAYKVYTLQPDSNMTLIARYTKTVYTTGSASIKLMNSKGEILLNEALFNGWGSFAYQIQGDSTYILEIRDPYDRALDYVLQLDIETAYDTSLVYGDTVTNKLKYNNDTDIYYFRGEMDDLVSIQGSSVLYSLSYGSFRLLDSTGVVLSEKEIGNGSYPDYEILYKLPYKGLYYIEISSSRSDDFGTYQVILNKMNYGALPYNAYSNMAVTPKERIFYEIEIPENKITHISIISDESNGGYFHVFTGQDVTITKATYGIFITDRYSANYSDTLPAGKYYLVIKNNDAANYLINIWEAKPLEFDDKGLAHFNDTIFNPDKLNIYHFSGSLGDGIHALLKEINDAYIPTGLKMYFHSMYRDGNDPAYLWQYGLSYQSIDSTILDEAVIRINYDGDSSIVLAIQADSAGVFEFNLHHIEQSDNIIVDDDYSQYPDATTSSHIAAGLAVSEGGSLLLANGTYSSNIPFVVYSDSVVCRGQTKDEVFIRGIYKREYHYAMQTRSRGGSVHDLTISCPRENLYSLLINNQGISAENIDIIPLGEKYSETSGMTCSGVNTIIRNITITDSRSGIYLGGGDNSIIENCSINCASQPIYASGDHITIKNNTLVSPANYRAIEIRCSSGQGNNVVDSNNIVTGSNNAGSGYGVIEVAESGGSRDTNTTYVRYNTILSSSGSVAFNVTIGNPPSKVIIENNSYKCSYSGGGKPMMLAAGRIDGASTIIVRNNIFEGLNSVEAIKINGVQYISEDQAFIICNNNFRISPTASIADTNFIYVYTSGSFESDTANLYFVNNIFEGNGNAYLVKCNKNFSLYCDYNIVHDFSKYTKVTGTVIGTTNDILDDPLYTDDDLHIDPASPAINNGATPALFEYIPEIDIEGTARPQGAGYDIGAYEAE